MIYITNQYIITPTVLIRLYNQIYILELLNHTDHPVLALFTAAYRAWVVVCDSSANRTAVYRRFQFGQGIRQFENPVIGLLSQIDSNSARRLTARTRQPSPPS